MDDKNTKNRGLKKIIIDEEMYKSLLSMLDSSEADRLVALKSINQLDKKKNLAAMLFLRRQGACGYGHWSEDASSAYKYHKSLGIPDSNIIKHMAIYNAIKSQPEFMKENLEFFAKRLEEFLQNAIKTMTMDMVQEVTVKIKTLLPEMSELNIKT